MAFDKNMFVHWFQNHHLQFVPLFHVQGASVEQLASELYELRNSLTHEGIVKGFCEHIVLVDGVNSGFVHTGRFLFVPVQSFCELVFDVAKIVFEDYERRNRAVPSFCSYSGCGVDASVYARVDCFMQGQFRAFWEKYGYEAQVLNRVYETVFLDVPGQVRKVEEHFAKMPDEPYVIERIDACSPVSYADNIVCFSKKYYRADKLCDGIILYMSKSQFDYMREIHGLLSKYAKFVNDMVAEMLRTGGEA